MSEAILIRPWADILYKTKLTKEVLDDVKKYVEETLNSSDKVSWGTKLAGQIKTEVQIPNDYIHDSLIGESIVAHARNYIEVCLRESNTAFVEGSVKIGLRSCWIVYQEEGEYNPLHHHTECRISGVFYIQVPEFLESVKSYRGFHDDGKIVFVGGVSRRDELTRQLYHHMPTVGEMFIFPSHMMHTVYPFKSKDKIPRISVSFNLLYDYKKPGQEEKQDGQ